MKTMIRAAICAFTMISGAPAALAADVPPAAPAPDMEPGKARVFVLSDVGNEPDDQMSFVRLLLYSNEIDIEGIGVTTSTWQKSEIHPETFHAIVADYAKVRPNLLLNAPGWPTAAQIDSRIAPGQTTYGMAATGLGKSTAASRALIAAADRPDPRPLWVSIWGGANTLAQALIDVKASRSPADLARFIARLRITAISDQDDAGTWIRKEFPDLFYVVTPSTPDGGEYSAATWTGISGDVYYSNGDGADTKVVTNEWLEQNIRTKGPLGKDYPRFKFIMEGDTPAYLSFIGNGLESYRSPGWGGWGGRYVYRQPYGETHPIWSQGGDISARIDSRDTVTGIDGKQYISNQATIWRWRDAFQNDFSARLNWSILPFAKANHAPQVTVNGQAGIGVVPVSVKAGDSVTLSAAGTRDPDGQPLTYHWFVYGEAGYSEGVRMAGVTLDGADTPTPVLHATTACRAQWLPADPPVACPSGQAQVILAVTDSGTPALTSYRRILVTVAQ